MSAHVFGIKYRPRNSGVHGDKLRVILGNFLEYNDADSEVFLKYCDRIGRALNMPTGTREERHALLQMLADSNFFFNRGAFPKLGNWFAWNKSAHESLDFWWAEKMIFEWSEEDLSTEDTTNWFSFTIRAEAGYQADDIRTYM